MVGLAAAVQFEIYQDFMEAVNAIITNIILSKTKK